MKSDRVFITHSYRIWFSAPCILYILRHYVTTRRIKYLITTYLSNFVESTVALLTSDNKFKNLNVANILKIMLSPKTVISPFHFQIVHILEYHTFIIQPVRACLQKLS